LLDTGVAYIDEENRFYDLVISQSPLGEMLQQKGAIEPYPADTEVLGKLGTNQLRTLCGYALAQMEFVVVDDGYLKIDGLLGHGFFLKYSVFAAFSTGEVYLKPRDAR
jgi:hypothetical protein